jgi:hypothetical protein
MIIMFFAYVELGMFTERAKEYNKEAIELKCI